MCWRTSGFWLCLMPMHWLTEMIFLCWRFSCHASAKPKQNHFQLKNFVTELTQILSCITFWSWCVSHSTMLGVVLMSTADCQNCGKHFFHGENPFLAHLTRCLPSTPVIVSTIFWHSCLLLEIGTNIGGLDHEIALWRRGGGRGRAILPLDTKLSESSRMFFQVQRHRSRPRLRCLPFSDLFPLNFLGIVPSTGYEISPVSTSVGRKAAFTESRCPMYY